MRPSSIPPEAYLDLKIHLDRLAAAQGECVTGLGELISGTLSVEEYHGLLHRQSEAQRAWVRRHEKYFGSGQH